MKTYKISQLRTIARDQGYTMAGLENINGERVVPFNQPNKKISIDKQLGLIETRLKSDINQDGVYNVVMAANISRARNPDRYPITKGNVPAETLQEAERKQAEVKTVIVEKNNQVLTWESAVEMHKELATLRAENAALKKERDELLAELDELEEEDETGLSEGGIMSGLKFLGETLKDLVPNVTPMVDRYFDLEERRVSLEESRLNGKKSSYKSNGQARRVIILPGSQEHLTLIEHYASTNQEDKLNAELDKLEAANPTLYQEVLVRLDMTEEEEEGGENE